MVVSYLGSPLWTLRYSCKEGETWMGLASYAKEICVDIFCRLSTMQERDTQTDRQTDHGTSIAISEIAR